MRLAISRVRTRSALLRGAPSMGGCERLWLAIPSERPELHGVQGRTLAKWHNKKWKKKNKQSRGQGERAAEFAGEEVSPEIREAAAQFGQSTANGASPFASMLKEQGAKLKQDGEKVLSVALPSGNEEAQSNEYFVALSEMGREDLKAQQERFDSQVREQLLRKLQLSDGEERACVIMDFQCDADEKICEQKHWLDRRSAKAISLGALNEGVVLVRCPCEHLHLIADNLNWFGGDTGLEEVFEKRKAKISEMVQDGSLHLDADVEEREEDGETSEGCIRLEVKEKD